MDPRFGGFLGSANGIQLRNESFSPFPDRNPNGPRFETLHSDQNMVNGPRNQNTFLEHNFGGVQFFPSDPPTSNLTSISSLVVEDDHSEDLDFSDAVLRYINQMLMEEDMEEKTYMLQESLDLQAKERSFYEALGKKYPPSPVPDSTFLSQNGANRDEYFFGDHHNITSTSSYSRSCMVDSCWISNAADYDATSLVRLTSARNASNSSVSSSNSINNLVDRFLDSPVSSLRIPDESKSIWNFHKGVEEASKFLPDGNNLLNFSSILPHKQKRETDGVAVKAEGKYGGEIFQTGSKGKKNAADRDMDLEEEEGRSSKQAAVYTESTVRSEEFDIILLHSMGKGQAALEACRENLQAARSNKEQQNGQSKGNGGKGRSKKQSGKKDVIDLRTLLIHCAQAVAADDRRNANELLKQVRQHAFPFGDGNQRLAHCFADGLEARLAGTGSQIYKALVKKRTSAADFLKAYHLYLASCPFRKMSCFASNKTIMIKSKNAARVHVIDFGILYGFQWPTLIQRIAGRKGGPPKLRITGIEFPKPGFRPAEQIEETGRRLTEYAKMFDVPFDYNPLAKRWETITLEDLKIEEDEFIVVSSIYRFKNLHDETLSVDSSRTIVLNLIRKINPNIFIHGILNGAYSAPFFVTRFREALFHFSALFDMLETIVPGEYPERMLIEKEIFGREALNVIACEGWERVERPETYKQWQVRNLRAGFRQIPFEQEIMSRAIEKVTTNYHKDFVIDEDNHWLLLGWKGRIIYALSCWQPV